MADTPGDKWTGGGGWDGLDSGSKGATLQSLLPGTQRGGGLVAPLAVLKGGGGAPVLRDGLKESTLFACGWDGVLVASLLQAGVRCFCVLAPLLHVCIALAGCGI